MSDTFGARLERILIDRNMTQTDLARLVFDQDEPSTDSRGYEIVRGKDRISSYVNGRQLPSRINYKKILQVLLLTEGELPLCRRQLRQAKEQRSQRLNQHLLEEIATLTAERDNWKQMASQLSDVVAALAVQLKEGRQ